MGDSPIQVFDAEAVKAIVEAIKPAAPAAAEVATETAEAIAEGIPHGKILLLVGGALVLGLGIYLLISTPEKRERSVTFQEENQ